MQQFIVEANPREERGKNAARRIRRTGLVPATLYGGTRGPVAVSVNAKQVVSILKSESGHNTIFTLKLAGVEDKVIVKDWQADPVRGDLLHVDLLRIAMDVRMRVKVPVHTFGEPQGVKLQGGIFEMVTREVEIECLPTDIPEEFRVDVTPLMIGKHVRAGELPVDPAKMKLITDPERVIAHVVALRVEEEVKPAEAVAEEAAAPAEPEVIKKGKKEVEEGEEAEAGQEKAEKPEKAEKKK
ncbi:MAG TPA: 50S ribosomal protein L25 [Candidatus Acidoferrales bacterium]|nr:50S ribosomal protein L25 [Candidatus Acidoferrales bacterium]